MQLISNEELTNILAGRRVVILGSAPSVLKNNGDFIDNFDIIIRLNNYKIYGYRSHVGSRTDIYYSFFGKSIKKTNEELKEDGTRWIMCKYPNANFTAHNGGKIEPGISDNCKWVYDFRRDWFKLPTWIPTIKQFKKNFDLLNRIPTTGVSCILDVLKFKPKSIYITGFDFFDSMIHNTNEAWKPGDGNHDHAREKELVYKLFLDKKIMIDETIRGKICQ